MVKHVIGEDSPGKKVILMGNEAVARGAIEGGVHVVSGYPGTPSSETIETLSLVAPELGFYVEWSTNEKVAFEVAAGAAITGMRSLVTMKNAGLNWCADMFMTLVYGGVRGGFVIFVADDPGAHYSSNEQDTRFMAMYGEIPCLEPSDQQEAKDMAKAAFEISERLELPVQLRSVTRISHASGDVTFGEISKISRKAVFDKHWKIPFRWNVYGPPSPIAKHKWLHSRIPLMKKLVEELPFNKLKLKEKAKLGVIASGVASAYAMDAIHRLGIEDKVSFLKIGTPHPLPEKKVLKLLNSVGRVAIIEEGDPLVELLVKSIAKDNELKVKIFGKSTNQILPPYDELSPDMVTEALAKVLGIKYQEIPKSRRAIKDKIKTIITPRSSTLCPGCPHLGSYWCLKLALRMAGGKVWIVNGDIGCYEQGGYGIAAKKIEPSFSEESVRYDIEAPYEILDTNYIMGGGIGLAQGQFKAGYKDGAIVAVAGDSTFYHACIPALINMVYNNSKVKFIVLDNSWTCMTGFQPNPATGITATGEPTRIIKIEDIARACGVEFVKVTDPYDLKMTRDTIVEALKYDGPALVISRRLCALQAERERQKAGIKAIPYTVKTDTCTGCKLCVQLGCPAITFDAEKKKAGIDKLLCIGCGMCAQLCPFKAIVKEE
jgi:indolepyruvate ferredoxin oxidoreductase alpha subunit